MDAALARLANGFVLGLRGQLFGDNASTSLGSSSHSEDGIELGSVSDLPVAPRTLAIRPLETKGGSCATALRRGR